VSHWKPGSNFSFSLSSVAPLVLARGGPRGAQLGGVAVRDAWDGARRDVSVEFAEDSGLSEEERREQDAFRESVSTGQGRGVCRAVRAPRGMGAARRERDRPVAVGASCARAGQGQGRTHSTAGRGPDGRVILRNWSWALDGVAGAAVADVRGEQGLGPPAAWHTICFCAVGLPFWPLQLSAALEELSGHITQAEQLSRRIKGEGVIARLRACECHRGRVTAHPHV
jgi:hypothetical protein